MILSVDEIAWLACSQWISTDPARWAAVLPDPAAVVKVAADGKSAKNDPAKWAALASPLALVVRDAIAVPMAESSKDTEAQHRSTTSPVGTPSYGNWDHGEYQISNYWHGAKLIKAPRWRDPRVNTALAFQVWTEWAGTWDAWSVYTSKAYQQYWPDAQVALLAPWPPPPDTSALLESILARVSKAPVDQTAALTAVLKQLGTLQATIDAQAKIITEIRAHLS